MTHQEYLLEIENKILLLDKKVLLFWDLWCLEYAIKKIATTNKYYQDIENSYQLLWSYNDKKICISDLFDHQSVQNIINFDNDEFDNLNDADSEENAIKEIIVGLESIFANLKENGQVIYNAYEIPINIVDIEIEGILITTENKNLTYLDLVESQFRLLDDLIENQPNYNYQNRSIYYKV